MNTVKLANKNNVKMVAHRGVSGIEPENTNAAFIAADQGFLFAWDEGKKTVVAHYGTDLALTNRCDSDKIESRYDAALIPQSKKLQLYDNGSGRSYDYYYGLDGLYRIQEGGLQ